MRLAEVNRLELELLQRLAFRAHVGREALVGLLRRLAAGSLVIGERQVGRVWVPGLGLAGQDGVGWGKELNKGAWNGRKPLAGGEAAWSLGSGRWGGLRVATFACLGVGRRRVCRVGCRERRACTAVAVSGHGMHTAKQGMLQQCTACRGVHAAAVRCRAAPPHEIASRQS